jgi:hypothetical protein
VIIQELVATLGIDVDSQVFSRAEAAIRGVTTGLLGLAAAGVGAIVGLGAIVRSTAEAGAHVKDLSNKLGVSTQALQELEYAAKLDGIDFESLTTGLRMLSRGVQEAKDGSTEFAATFRKLHIDPKFSNDTEEMLKQVADAFADGKLKTQAEKTSVAMQLFGRSGTELIPLLEEGADGIEELRARARELGIVMSDETIAASAKFDDTLDDLGFALRGLKFAIGTPLIGAFTKLATAISAIVVETQKWIKTNLPKFLDKTATAGKNLEIVLTGIKVSLSALAIGLGLYKLSLVSITLETLKLTAAQLAWGSAALIAGARAALGAALAIAPWLAIGAFIALLANDLYVFVEGGDSLIGRMIHWFDQFDPDSSPLIELLRAAGSLLFDLGDPEKMKRVGNAISRVFESLTDILADPVKKFANWFAAQVVDAFGYALNAKINQFTGSRTTVQEKAGSMLGGMLDLSQMFLDPFTGGAATPAIAGIMGSVIKNVGGSTSTNAPTMHAQITVTVPPGSDAGAVGNATRDALDSWWDSAMSRNLVAVDQ